MLSVVITGAASGIGYETAKLVVEKGGRVFANVRREADAVRLRAELGEAVTPLLFDVRDEAGVRRGAEQVRAALQGRTLGGLVNNAAIAVPGPLLHQPLSEIRDQLDTNLLASFITAQAFGPLLGADPTLSGPPGRIVSMSSIGGKIGQPFASAYIAAKHGLEGFSDALRRELMIYGIDVIIVAPGVVATPIWDKVEAMDRSRYAQTDFAEPLEAGVKTMLTAGREHGLDPNVVAQTIWRALTDKTPKARYAPAQHPLFEQGLLMALPRRVLDRAMARQLGVKRPARAKRA